MYERFYNLRERPFALSPDPEYLYLSRVHREALDSLRYGIESRAGFIVVTGEIGAGKTTLLQSLLQRLDDRTIVARIVNTTLDPRELLEAILLDFGLETTGKSKPALLRDLGDFLVGQRKQGRRALLVIDEAQNLSPPSLEEVRLLSNLETEKSKLLHILLVGQPDLRETITAPQLEQFRQRVAVSYHLTALDAPDTAAYINFRLQHAALGDPPRFREDAAQLIHRVSGGVPRIINVICDAALVFGYAEERQVLDRPLIQEVVKELSVTGVLPTATNGQRAAVVAATGFAPAGGSAADSVAAAPPAIAVAGAGEADDEVARQRRLLAAKDAELKQARQLAASQDEELARQRDLLSRRQSELLAREEALATREHQIAEQRRIMTEEYRLLRQRQTGPPVGGPAASSGRFSSLQLTGGPPNERAAPFWQRLYRLFTGEPVRS